MKLKVDANGVPVLVDGKPVYVADDGKEFPIDGGQLYGRVRELTTENTAHRTARTEAETKLKVYEAIPDPAAAIAALETVANLDQGQLVTAGKVEEIKLAAKKAAEEQVAAAIKTGSDNLAAATTQIETLTGELYAEKIGGAFGRSKYVAEKIAVPADMLQATFGKAFKVEDGKAVAYDHTGNKIYSRVRPGELADFDEALETLVTAYPNKDHILKGAILPGGGGGGGGGLPGAKTMTKTAFEALPAKDRAAKMAEAGFALTDG